MSSFVSLMSRDKGRQSLEVEEAPKSMDTLQVELQQTKRALALTKRVCCSFVSVFLVALVYLSYMSYLKKYKTDSVWMFEEAYSAGYALRSRDFLVNRDLDLGDRVSSDMGRFRFMLQLKEATKDKQTLIVVNDKINMAIALKNLNIPQCETLFVARQGFDESELRRQLQNIRKAGKGIMIKPTHTSNSDGTMPILDVAKGLDEQGEEKVVAHVKNCFKLKAHSGESWALRNMQMGVIIQSLYVYADKDNVEKGALDVMLPLEVKVQTVWGRFFVGVMERKGADGGANVQHWIRRDGISSCDAQPNGLKENVKCSEMVDKLTKSSLDKMIQFSELIAARFGAPWLRVDFFIGGEDGLKLNELAYGSGIGYPLLENDIPRSMTVGFAAKKYPTELPSHFMEPLGCVLKTPSEAKSIECKPTKLKV